MTQKQEYFRSKKLLSAARDCPVCMMCGRQNDGTIVAAHYQGFRQHELGKGAGIKPTDTATAFLCHDCHDMVDGRSGVFTGSITDSSEEFLLAIVKTHDWLFTQGVFK